MVDSISFFAKGTGDFRLLFGTKRLAVRMAIHRKHLIVELGRILESRTDCPTENTQKQSFHSSNSPVLLAHVKS